jgi:hypothetical protein
MLMMKLTGMTLMLVVLMGNATADVVYPLDMQRMQSMQNMMYPQNYANAYRQSSVYPQVTYPQTPMVARYPANYTATNRYNPYSAQQYAYQAWNQSAWRNPWQSASGVPVPASGYGYPQSTVMYPQQYVMQRPPMSSAVQQRPPMQRPPAKPAPKQTKAWGDVRHIWPDFYTDFTDEAWDWMIGSPRDMGYMPGGWRFPYISMPDPVTVADAVANQIPPIMEEVPNFAPMPSQY